jgi:heterodisulfide reductase subunit B
MYQGEASVQLGEPLNVPVLYFTQLLGLAAGVEPERLGLNKLIVSSAPVLEKIGADHAEIYL